MTVKRMNNVALYWSAASSPSGQSACSPQSSAGLQILGKRAAWTKILQLKTWSSYLVKFFLNARKRWQYTDPKDEYNFKRKKMEKDYAEMCIISICLLESTTFNCLYKFQVLRITVTYKNICPTGLWMFHFTQITVNVISF